MMKKRVFSFLLFMAVLTAALTLTSCKDNRKAFENDTKNTTASHTDKENAPDIGVNSDLEITFEGDSINAGGSSAVLIDGSTVRIKAGGRYILAGTLHDGSVIVDAPKNEKVELVLNGVSIKCSKSAPLYIMSCDKVKIISAEGSINEFSDSVNYKLPDGEDKPNACIYSSEDIDFEGSGTIIVNGNYNNGIGSKNDIDIESGIIEVSAVNNAIKGNDSVSIMGGVVRITGSDDGIKSDNETDANKGFVRIENGAIEITADDDAIQAHSSVSITGGTITTNVGGKSVKCDGNITLAEGILTEN